jgi:phenylacetate-CoA ligase
MYDLYKRLEDPLFTLLGVVKFHTLLKKTESYNETEIQRYQQKQLSSLLVYCSKHIPFYRRQFVELNIDPYGQDAVAELKKLPILTKEIVRNNYEYFISSKERNSLEFQTSGTSGDPFTVLTSTNQWVVEQGVVWRSWKRAGYRFRDKIAIIRSYNPNPSQPKIKRDTLKNWRYYSVYHMDDASLAQYFKDFKVWKPKYLRGYPGSILLLANYADKNNLKLEGLRGILTASERLEESVRQRIEDIFQTRVYDHYGQAEITAMYHNCEVGKLMHDDWEYGFSEFIPHKKNEHKLIATNLHNRSMPLLRYDTGDLVCLSDIKCRCGRQSVALKQILGRSMNFIEDSDNVSYPIVNLYTHFADKKTIKQFQICQYVAGKLEVKLKFWDSVSSEEALLETEMISLYLKKFKCEASFSNEPFLMSEDGKLTSFISRLGRI